MAVRLEFLNFIVPIGVIKEKYPGGWAQCLKDHEGMIGGRVWFDEHLFRNGAMNSMDMHFLIKDWQSLGFRTHDSDDNPTRWIDVCVVSAMSDAPTLPCEWIEVDRGTAFYKGTPKGDVIGREEVRA